MFITKLVLKGLNDPRTGHPLMATTKNNVDLALQ